MPRSSDATPAFLELIQGKVPTTAELVSRCLYGRIDIRNRLDAVTEALDQIRARNLFGYPEEHADKVQWSASENWERERRDIIGETVRGGREP